MWKSGAKPWYVLIFPSTEGCGGVARVFHNSFARQVFHISHIVFHGEKSENVDRLHSVQGAYLRELMLEVMAFTVSAKEASLAIRCSTCSMECMTVVWSRPPNSLPMSA